MHALRNKANYILHALWNNASFNIEAMYVGASWFSALRLGIRQLYYVGCNFVFTDAAFVAVVGKGQRE